MATGLLCVGMLAIDSARSPASAANLCTPRAAMIDALARKYHEQRRGMGIASRTGVLEFYVSQKGTWTMVMSMPNGISCIVAAGKDWEEITITPTGTSS
jgi:hypothetical protein